MNDLEQEGSPGRRRHELKLVRRVAGGPGPRRGIRKRGQSREYFEAPRHVLDTESVLSDVPKTPSTAKPFFKHTTALKKVGKTKKSKSSVDAKPKAFTNDKQALLVKTFTNDEQALLVMARSSGCVCGSQFRWCFIALKLSAKVTI